MPTYIKALLKCLRQDFAEAQRDGQFMVARDRQYAICACNVYADLSEEQKADLAERAEAYGLK